MNRSWKKPRLEDSELMRKLKFLPWLNNKLKKDGIGDYPVLVGILKTRHQFCKVVKATAPAENR